MYCSVVKGIEFCRVELSVGNFVTNNVILFCLSNTAIACNLATLIHLSCSQTSSKTLTLFLSSHVVLRSSEFALLNLTKIMCAFLVSFVLITCAAHYRYIYLNILKIPGS